MTSSLVLNSEFMDKFLKKMDEKYYRGFDERDSFQGKKGESIVIRTRLRFMGDIIKARRRLPNLVFLNVGNILVIDNRLESVLSEITGAQNYSNVISLWNFLSFLNHHPNNLMYSALALHTLEGIDFRGKTVLDLGCGEGVLGLYALKNGARKVIGVDGDRNYESLIKNNLKLNFQNPSNFLFVNTFFHDLKTVFDRSGADKIDIALLNIGPHFGPSDLFACGLLGFFPSIKIAMGAGYSLASPALSPTRALIKLAKQGFRRNFKKIVHRNGHLSFLIEK